MEHDDQTLEFGDSLETFEGIFRLQHWQKPMLMCVFIGYEPILVVARWNLHSEEPGVRTLMNLNDRLLGGPTRSYLSQVLAVHGSQKNTRRDQISCQCLTKSHSKASGCHLFDIFLYSNPPKNAVSGVFHTPFRDIFLMIFRGTDHIYIYLSFWCWGCHLKNMQIWS